MKVKFKGCKKEVKALGDTFYCGQDIGIRRKDIYYCGKCERRLKQEQGVKS